MYIQSPGRPLPHKREPPLPPAACASAPLPWLTFLWPGFANSRPPRGKHVTIVVIAGGGNYPPPGQLLCPKNGGTQIGPGGKSNWWTSPGNPPLVTPRLLPPEGKKFCTSGVSAGKGGPSQAPPSHPVLDLTMGRQ